MRVPKFRVYDKVECMMITTSDYEDLSDLFCILKNDADTGYISELMQFTGLKDVHGKEVFEGDIVKIPEDYDKFGRNAGEILKVAFNNGCFRLKRPNSKGRGFYFEDDNTVTIIGNIYENPELLGEDE